MKRLTPEQIAAAREVIRLRIERKIKAHQSVADDYAELKSLTTQSLKATVRARKKKAA